MQPNSAIKAKKIASISLLPESLNEPPILAANISNAKANKALMPMNLAMNFESLLSETKKWKPLK